jgi:hypothetical protein
MLNGNKDCDDSAGYDGNDIYLVTDANLSDGDEDITHLAAELVDNASNLGLLILDGEDYYVDRIDDEGTVHGNNNNFEIHKEENRQDDNDSRSLSIPDTLSLPSGLRSMLASGFTNVQDKQNMVESTGDNNIDPSQHAVRLQRFGKFKMMNSSVIML